MRTNAFVSEVARFLEMEPERVKRMVRTDDLPALEIPAATKMVLRIPLRALHGWWLERCRNVRPEMRDFATWSEDFWESANRTKTRA